MSWLHGSSPVGTHQIVEDVAGAALVPLQDLVFEPRVRTADFREPIGGEGHVDAPLRVAETLALLSAPVKSPAPRGAWRRSRRLLGSARHGEDGPERPRTQAGR